MHNENSKKRQGPPPGKGMNPGEKPKDFKVAITQLAASLSNFKISIIIALVLAGLSAILTLTSPDILSNLTDEISKGLVINTENMEKLQEDLTSNINEEKLPQIMQDILNL